VTLQVPYRGDGADRPVDLTRMPMLLHGRPRKRWRYVGVFGDRLMVCAGVVQVGPSGQTFWAVWDRERRELHERTRLGPGGRRAVALPDGAVRVRDGAVSIDLTIEPGEAVETATPAGAAWIWTRKQGGVRVHGTVELGGRRLELDAPGCVDDSAGYHERRTDWEWSAGAGRTGDGRAVAWNLVTGIHDSRVRSERTVWLDGRPEEVAPVTFSESLDEVAFAGGERLRFAAEATRRRVDDLKVFRSDYVQPFGVFSGTLPGGLRLESGRGVMERHAARW
jgi:hypothetical protein